MTAMDRWLLCRAVLLYIEMSDQWHFFKKIWGGGDSAEFTEYFKGSQEFANYIFLLFKKRL